MSGGPDLASLTFSVDSSGVDAAATSLDRLGASAANAGRGAQSFSQGTSQAAQAAAQGAQQFSAAAIAASAGGAAFAAGARQAQQSVNGAGVSTAQFTGFVNQATLAQMAAAIASNNFGQATARAGMNFGVAGQQAQFLAYQINDILTSLGSGMSPMQVLAQQGGQVYQALSMNGGVGSTLSSITRALGAMLTPARLAMGGLAGIATTGLVIAYNWRSGQAEIRAALSGIGQASGATVQDINAIAMASSKASDSTVGFTRSIAAAMAATGKIDVSNIGRLTTQARALSDVFNLGTAETGALMSKVFNDPAKGAEILNEKLGFLSARTKEYITTLQAQGRITEAQAALSNAMNPALEKAQENLTALDRMWRGFVSGVSQGANTVAQAVEDMFTGGGLDQQRSATQRALDAARNSGGLRYDDTTRSMVRGDNSAQIRDLERKLAEIDARLADRSRATLEAQTQAQSLRAQGIIDSLNPVQTQIVTIEGQVQQLREMLATDPNGVYIDVKKANDAIFQLTQKAKELREQERAGGPLALQAQRDNAYQLRIEGASEYTKKLEEINKRYEDLIRNAKTLEEMDALKIERDTTLGLAQRDYVRTGVGTSRYNRSVSDAPSQYQGYFTNYGGQYGVSPDLLAAQSYRESRWNPNAVSPAGARGFSQFMPGTARDYGVDVNDPESSIRGQAKYMQDLLRRYQGDESLALAGYNWGQGNVDKALKQGRGIETFPKETREYIAEILQAKANTEEVNKTTVDWDRTLDQTGQTLQTQTQFLGKSAYEMDKANYIQQKMADLQSKGITITEGMTEAIGRQAERYAVLNRNIAAVAMQREIDFERQQLGRDSVDQGIASRLRGANIDAESPAGRYLADQMRYNEALKLTKELGTEAFSGILSDLRSGASLADAFKNALNRIVDRLLSMLADKAISGLMNSLFSGGSGVGSFFSNLFGMGSSGGSIGSSVTSESFGPAIPANFAGYHAKGGNIPAGYWGITGEAGPEVVNGPATVTPMNKIGGGGVVININEGAGTTTSVSQNDDGSVSIDTMVKGIEGRMASNMSRGKGPLSKASRSTLSRANLRG